MNTTTKLELQQQLFKNPHLLNILNNIPKIDIQNKSEFATNIENIIREFPDTQYSNFTLKWFEIVQRIDCVNNLINDLFQDFVILNIDLDIDPIIDSAKKTPVFL